MDNSIFYYHSITNIPVTMDKENKINNISNYLTEVQFNRRRVGLYVLSGLICLIAIFGNALVLYATYGKSTLLRGTVVQDLDIVIKSLAVTDFLIGLVGIPIRILGIKLTENFDWENSHFEGNFVRGK